MLSPFPAFSCPFLPFLPFLLLSVDGLGGVFSSPLHTMRRFDTADCWSLLAGRCLLVDSVIPSKPTMHSSIPNRGFFHHPNHKLCHPNAAEGMPRLHGGRCTKVSMW
jgi:hypothetical protein